MLAITAFKKQINFDKRILVLYWLAYLFDLITTYYGSPDLAKEANILVTNFNFGWIKLILFQSLLFGLYSYLYWVSFYKTDLVISLHKFNLDFRKFLLNYLCRGNNYYTISLYLPQNVGKKLNPYIGWIRLFMFTIIYVSTASKFISSFQNLIYGAIHQNSEINFFVMLGEKWSKINIQVWKFIELEFIHPTLIIKTIFIDILMVGTAIYFLCREYFFFKKINQEENALPPRIYRT